MCPVFLFGKSNPHGPIAPISFREIPRVLIMAYRALHDLAPPPISFVSFYFPPFSPCCSHTGLLTKPNICQPSSRLRGFAWSALLNIHWLAHHFFQIFAQTALSKVFSGLLNLFTPTRSPMPFLPSPYQHLIYFTYFPSIRMSGP